MVSSCANPNCSKPLHYLREGRVFVFDLPDPNAPAFAGRNARRMQHFWLCGECCLTLQVLQVENGVRVVPLAKRTRSRRLDEMAVPQVLAS